LPATDRTVRHNLSGKRSGLKWGSHGRVPLGEEFCGVRVANEPWYVKNQRLVAGGERVPGYLNFLVDPASAGRLASGNRTGDVRHCRHLAHDKALLAYRRYGRSLSSCRPCGQEFHLGSRCGVAIPEVPRMSDGPSAFYHRSRCLSRLTTDTVQSGVGSAEVRALALKFW
jgi:hypothetical protein